MAKDVVIDNPVVGGRAKTTINRAHELVTAGRAVYTGPRGEPGASIRFVNELAQRAIDTRRTGLSYDHLVGQWVKCARHIPLIHPEKMRV
jgi:hypothetical protein